MPHVNAFYALITVRAADGLCSRNRIPSRVAVLVLCPGFWPVGKIADYAAAWDAWLATSAPLSGSA